MASYYGPELVHHGVIGQKWGIRRYQPYPKGDGPKGKFLGNAASNVKWYFDKDRGAHDAKWYRKALVDEQKELAVKDLKAKKRAGEISKLDYKSKLKEVRGKARSDKKYASSKEFKKEAIEGAVDRSYEGIIKPYLIEIISSVPESSLEKTLVRANEGSMRLLNKKMLKKMEAIGDVPIAAANAAVAIKAAKKVLNSEHMHHIQQMHIQQMHVRQMHHGMP